MHPKMLNIKNFRKCKLTFDYASTSNLFDITVDKF